MLRIRGWSQPVSLGLIIGCMFVTASIEAQTEQRSSVERIEHQLESNEQQGASEQLSADDLEFFESKIRPVLVESCYECHNSADVAEGGFVVDFQGGLLAGGDTGQWITPGDSSASQLLSILRHEVVGLEMPMGGPKLDDSVLADFQKWIDRGLPDPRDKPPSEEEVAAALSWETLLERRKEWWSLQPISPVEPPPHSNPDLHEVDRFVDRKLKENGLQQSGAASHEVLIRRLFLTLTGLPPSADATKDWLQRLESASPERTDEVIEQLVDQLLASSAFGERWARHWMDWMRYAESHGSEGDPMIPGASLYRDYLIRAVNQDVPIDQLIREHIAGDLLAEPRLNAAGTVNESIIGTAHWRMVFHGFAPTDALEEKTRFIDDEINVFSKSFLGLTVSCARCHNHKFDAISQADYYALYGILSTCRPSRQAIEPTEMLTKRNKELLDIKSQLKQALAEVWLSDREKLEQAIRHLSLQEESAFSDLMKPIYEAQSEIAAGSEFQPLWTKLTQQFQNAGGVKRSASEAIRHWDFSREEVLQRWYRIGVGASSSVSASGEFSVAVSGDQAITSIYPAGFYSHTVSNKLPARLTSPDISLSQASELWVQVIGDGRSMVRFVAQDYPRQGTVYPVIRLSNNWRWEKLDLSYWSGDDVHIELNTAADAPVLAVDQSRSWFGIRRALLLPKGTRLSLDVNEVLDPLMRLLEEHPPQSIDDLVGAYAESIQAAVVGWRDGTLTDSQALLLDRCLELKLLENDLAHLPQASELVEAYRRIENEVPVANRIPTLEETKGEDHALFVRGDHRQPTDIVPRRFLEAIDDSPYLTLESGRRQLADSVLHESNPLTRRVMANRIWHHLFGKGLVATPDNFGRLGDTPSHPELLDWLANRLAEEGWSLKKMVRLIVLSQTWQASSSPTALALEKDPDNRWLSHANLRRLEAEAIRDSLLTVSGTLIDERPNLGVEGDSAYRSLYVTVKRNSLDPFLRAFDFPEPVSSVGRRSVTNVPAQSLMLMNDPRMASFAEAFASRALAQSVNDGEDKVACRVDWMFLAAFGRHAKAEEIQKARVFLQNVAMFYRKVAEEKRQLGNELASSKDELATMLAPIRQELLSRQLEIDAAGSAAVPKPIAAWDFTKSVEDQIGEANVRLVGQARQAGDGLQVNAEGYAISDPIRLNISAKTLQAWIQLENDTQGGGAAISIQSKDGTVFDSIVFAEAESKRWMSGSDFFRRTESFQGEMENLGVERPVHVSISYFEDGSIVAYRNGVPYGNSYRTGNVASFQADETILTFGLRHLPASANKQLVGRIISARVYDRGLNAEETLQSYRQTKRFVTKEELWKELNPQKKADADQLELKIKKIEKRIEELQDVPQTIRDEVIWSELAHAMFTFQEFVYVR